MGQLAGRSLELGNGQIDKAGKSIMRSISQDARAPITEIAKKTGLAPSVIGYRLRKLQDDGIIIGYAVALNYGQLGLRFVQINISLADPSAKKKIIGYFEATDKCLFAMEIVGKYDLIIEVFIRDPQELAQVIEGFRRKFHEAYHEYDVSTITKEHVVLWLPLAQF